MTVGAVVPVLERTIDLPDMNRGMTAVEQNISYKRELVAGDTVSIYSTVIEVKDRVLRFAHEMRSGSDLAASSILTAVHLDTAARRACALPAEVKAKAHVLAIKALA